MIDFLLIFCIKIKSNQNIFVFYSEYDQKVNANEWYLSQINREQRIEKYIQGIQGDAYVIKKKYFDVKKINK